MIDLLKELGNDLSKLQAMTMVKALICSFLNIIIYAVFFLLVFAMPQSKVFAVALFEDCNLVTLTGNVIVFHVLLYYLAYLMSIYPTYIYFMLFSGSFDDSMHDDEKKENLVFKSEKMGLIYFGNRDGCSDDYCSISPKSTSANLSKLSTLEGLVRKATAAGIFLLWSWLLVWSYYHYQTQFISGRTFWLCILAALSIIMLWVFWYFVVHVKRHIGLPIDFDEEARDGLLGRWDKLVAKYGGENKRKYVPDLVVYVKLRWMIIVGLLAVIVIVASVFGWSLTTVIVEFLISALLAIDLMIMRSFRKYIPKLGLFDRPCDHVVFLSRIRNVFWLVFSLFLLLNLSDTVAIKANALVTTLVGIIIFYYTVTMIIKFYLLNKYNEKVNTNYYNWNSLAYTLLLLACSIFFTYNLSNGNSLHKLILLNKDTEPVTVSEFYNSYKTIDNDTASVLLYAAYGGGLKAHNWNLLVLEELRDRGLMNNVLAMSGVSGGGMGLTSYTIMEYQRIMGIDMNRGVVQDSIASSNVLGLELAYYFGADFIRNMLPELLVGGKNRSHRAMNFYDEFYKTYNLSDSVSFDKVYKSIFQKEFYPNIIINSTNTINNYGVVSGVRDKSNLFPNAVNLLDINFNGKEKTLSFLEAASTCNRFPAISPAADVPTKGTFVDGGYYENSGIMSLLSFKKAIEEHENIDSSINIDQSIFKNGVKIVSVTNYEGSYLYSLVRDTLLKKDSNCMQGNQLRLKSNIDYPGVSAITSSITNLERNPSYYRAMLDRYHTDEYEVVHIDLPFYLYEDDINSYYGGELDTGSLCLVKKLVENSNRSILDILDADPEYDLENWGVINPPTSRMLSRPVEIYMEAMMKHPRVRDQLDAISSSSD